MIAFILFFSIITDLFNSVRKEIDEVPTNALQPSSGFA